MDSSAYNMLLAKEVKKFIRTNVRKTANKPFFAYVALGAAHIPHTPPIQYLDGSPVANVYPTRHMDILGEMDKVVGENFEKQIIDERYNCDFY